VVVGIMAERLLAAGLVALTVVGVGGCSLLGLGGPGGSSAGSSAGSSTSAGGTAQLPQQTVYQFGVAVSSAPVPNGSPIRTPLAQLPSVPMYPATLSWNPNWTPFPTVCVGKVMPGVRDGLIVIPGTTSAVIKFWNVGDPAISQYQLAAVSQDLVFGTQPPWLWINIAPKIGCQQTSATVTGLRSGGTYVFVLHAVVQNYESVPPIEPEVGRSRPTTML
jgi:hypothetical protein